MSAVILVLASVLSAPQFIPTDVSLYAPSSVNMGKGFWLNIVVDDTIPWITSEWTMEVSAVKTKIVYDTTLFDFLGYLENMTWRQFDVVEFDRGIIFSASDPLGHPLTPCTFSLQFLGLRPGSGALTPEDAVVYAPGSTQNTVATIHECGVKILPEPSSILLMAFGWLLLRKPY